MDAITLNNGVKMPQLGLGVFQISDYDVAKQSVLDGIQNGYRLIDTAAAYRNESAVGAAIQESGIDRKKLFVTSKLWVQDMSYEGAKQGFQTSLDNLGLDYIDLYLLHQPVGDTFGAWRALEEFYQAGKIRAIGVSNFDSAQLANLIAFNKVTPAVNQVELHVFNQKPEAIDYMRNKGVQPEAWPPFAEGKHHIFTQPLLKNIGDKYGKTPSQVALRWLLQRHVVAIPKSTHENRLIQNLDVFDFQLSADDMKEIATLDIGHSEIVNHQDPKFIEMLAGMKIHD